MLTANLLPSRIEQGQVVGVKRLDELLLKIAAQIPKNNLFCFMPSL